MLLLCTAPKISGCASEHGRSIPLAVFGPAAGGRGSVVDDAGREANQFCANVVRSDQRLTLQLADIAIPVPCWPRPCTWLTGCDQHLSHHDSDRSNSLQIARRGRDVRRAPGHALTARKCRWPGFGSQSRLDQEGRWLCRLPDQARTRVRPPHLLRYRWRRRSPGKSRVKRDCDSRHGREDQSMNRYNPISRRRFVAGAGLALAATGAGNLILPRGARPGGNARRDHNPLRSGPGLGTRPAQGRQPRVLSGDLPHVQRTDPHRPRL
jgi:hypothetical protein